MTGLVDQLEAAALDSAVPITDLLRKAKTVAVKLRRPDLAVWLDKEMSGYEVTDPVPPYRKMHCEIKFAHPHYGWRPVIGSDHDFDNTQSISEIMSLIASSSDFYTAPLPRKYIENLSRQFGILIDARRIFYRPQLIAVIDGVRNAVQDWALKLWEADIHGEGMSFTREETARAQHMLLAA